VDCRVRFNDAAVSRKHLQVDVSPGAAYVENLSRTNGSRVNGERLSSRRRLLEGDELQFGHRSLRVSFSDEEGADEEYSVPGATEAAPGLLIEEDGDSDEVTRPGPGLTSSLAGQAYDQRNCPQCRKLVSNFEDQCGGCGYIWPLGRPASRTQEIELESLVRRSGPRYIVRVPVIYSSEFLTLDAVARDLSLGGMFIATELLDPVGTECRVTALPDGHAALSFVGVVCHVSTEMKSGRPSGIGIQFTMRTPEAEAWLQATVKRAGDLLSSG
jgi:hypothetical protein